MIPESAGESGAGGAGAIPIAVLSDMARASAPGVHPVNADLARLRHSFWPALARRHGWDLRLHDAARLDAIVGSLAWIDLPLLSGALVVSALAADLAERAGHAPMSRGEVMKAAEDLSGQVAAESAGVWMVG